MFFGLSHFKDVLRTVELLKGEHLIQQLSSIVVQTTCYLMIGEGTKEPLYSQTKQDYFLTSSTT